MGHYILVYSHPEIAEQRFELAANRTYRVGSKSDNDILVPQKDVSRHHAIVRTFEGTFQVTDLNSKNGTFVNGNRVVSTEFRCGDQLNISSARLVVLEVSTGAYAATPEVRPTTPPVEKEDSREDTIKYRVAATLEDMVSLLETTSSAVARGAVAEPLTWAVDHLGLDAALVLYRDAEDNVAMVTSAGDLGSLVQDSGTLTRLVREQDRAVVDGPMVSQVQELGQQLLVAPLQGDHVLVIRFSGDPPAVGDMRALMAAEEAVLSSAHVSHASPSRVPGPLPGGARAEELNRIPGSSKAIETCKELAAVFARRLEPVLINGEPGTGKGLFARAIHDLSSRSGSPFELFDCAAIPSADCEARLLGSTPEPDSGLGGQVGAVVAADGGTLFLDEVTALPPDLQHALVTVIRERTVCGIGDAAPQPVDVRVIAATATNADRAVNDGRLEADLLQSLKGLRLQVPALRERPEDIPVAASKYLQDGAREGGKKVGGFTVDAMQALSRYRWPGNIRELFQEVQRILAVVGDGAVVELAQLSPEVVGRAGGAADVPDFEKMLHMPMDEARSHFERWMLGRVLETCGGNQTKAARHLGLSRAGLFKKMKKLEV